MKSIAIFSHMMCIYKITAPNGKIYIGRATNLQKRISDYKHEYNKYLKTGLLKHPKLFYSFNKYGFENFKIEPIHIVENNKNKEFLNKYLNIAEIYYIEKYNSYKEGLNSTIGGEGTFGFKRTKEQIERHVKNRTGKPWTEAQRLAYKNIKWSETQHIKDKEKHARDRALYGKCFPNRKKRKINDICHIVQLTREGDFVAEYTSRSYLSSNFNIICILTSCTKKKESHKNYIWLFYEDYISKNYDIKTFLKRELKPVVQLTKDGEIINIFKQTKDVEKLGFTATNVTRCCKGKATNNLYKGFKWEYYEG